MVRDKGRPDDRNANNVQDLELRGVSGPPNVVVYDESRGRRLSLRAVLFHDRHLSAGAPSSTQCGICSQGLEGALEASPQITPSDRESEVVQGGGVDQEGSAAPARAPGSSRRKDQVLRSGGS